MLGTFNSRCCSFITNCVHHSSSSSFDCAAFILISLFSFLEFDWFMKRLIRRTGSLLLLIFYFFRDLSQIIHAFGWSDGLNKEECRGSIGAATKIVQISSICLQIYFNCLLSYMHFLD